MHSAAEGMAQDFYKTIGSQRTFQLNTHGISTNS